MSLVCSLVSLFVILLTLSFAPKPSQAKKYTAFFIFGDSTLDPGNNNYIDTIPENKANYKPYGRNGFFPEPTGRFSDGRIFVDFIAEYAQLPLIPPMLAPSVDYSHGVNFGSGGAGILYSTNRDQGVIDLNTQLKYFEQVESKLKKRLGDDKARKIISNAVYFFSMGSNDYLGGYLSNPEMQQLYPPQQYVGMVIGNLTNTIKELYDKGARKFGFLSVSPLGCLPFTRALNSATPQGGCLEQGNALAMAHNDAVKTVLSNLQQLLPDFKYCGAEFYDWLIDRMADPSAYGFKEGIKACCGTGPFNGIYSCGGKKNVTSVYQVCDDGDDYVFWDSFHPTEKMHEQIAKALWNGPRASVGPYNLQELFLDYNHHHVLANAGEAA